MDDLLKTISGAQQGQAGQAAGGLEDVLGGLMGSGGLGSVLGAGAGAGVGNAMGGGLGSMLGGGLGALLPTILPAILGLLGSKGASGQPGLQQLVDAMHSNGLGDVAKSWVGTGPSLPISAAQVEQVLDSSQLAELAAKTGLPQDQIKSVVAAILPHVVSSLTPNGSVPDHAEVQQATNALQQALSTLTGGHPG